MLEELIAIHHEVMATTTTKARRYLYDQVNWAAQAICIFGDRGVGKTTLMCQYFLDVNNHEKDPLGDHLKRPTWRSLDRTTLAIIGSDHLAVI